MNTLLQKRLFSLICYLAVVCVLAGLLVPMPAEAGARQPVLPGGSSIKPGEKTLIQMASEVVTINIRQATEADNALVNLSPNIYPFQHNPIWFQAIAEVEADFTMKNPTREAISVTTWFPLASALETVDWKLYSGESVPRIEGLQVVVDSKTVDYRISELPNPKGADKPTLPWASFPVVFPGESETVIHLRYSLPPQPFGEIEMALYYIFQTGADWFGPIGWAELTLNLPYPASADTVAGMPFGSLRLPPYYRPSARADLPVNSSLNGNQVHLLWNDFEPGAGDDLAIWLLQPGTWQELETARAKVQANPQDGQAWLDLGSTYYLHLGSEFNSLSIFGTSFLPAGIGAYQKAAALMPGHPAPHAGLGLLALIPFLKYRNAPSDVIQYVQDECQIARELDARNPSLMKAAGISRWLLSRCENALDSILFNPATAVAQETAEGAAEQTANAVMLKTTSATPTMKDTLTEMPTQKHTLVATPIPSKTPQPIRSLSPTVFPTEPAEVQAGTGTGSGVSAVIIVAAGIIGVVVAGSLALKRLRKRVGK
jgi:hypothetical protein